MPSSDKRRYCGLSKHLEKMYGGEIVYYEGVLFVYFQNFDSFVIFMQQSAIF